MSIDGDSIQRIARDTAAGLEGIEAGYPFTPRLRVYKSRGRVFLIVTEDPDEQIITVKADPHHADALVHDHDTITPGRYLDKRHWVSVGAGKGITASLVEALVVGSYDLVSGSPGER